MDDGSGCVTERERHGVSGVSSVGGVGSAGLGRENEGHRFLARFEAAGIAARRSRGSMLRRDGVRDELTKRKGARARQSWVAETAWAADRWTRMTSAAYSGCAGVGGRRGDRDVDVSGKSTRTGRVDGVSTESSGGDGARTAWSTNGSGVVEKLRVVGEEDACGEFRAHVRSLLLTVCINGRFPKWIKHISYSSLMYLSEITR